MKKQLFLSAIAILLALHLNAQSNVEAVKGNDSALTWHRNVISTDPLYLAFGVLTVNYERVLSKKIGFFTRVTYQQTYWFQKYDILTNTIQIRWYPSCAAPHGFYLGGFSYYQHAWFKTGIDTTHYYEIHAGGTIDTIIHGGLNSLATGIIAGYKFIIKKRIAAEFYGGGGINFWWGKNEEYASISFDNNFQPHFGINVGYSFK